jgi:hypothetical protein
MSGTTPASQVQPSCRGIEGDQAIEPRVLHQDALRVEGGIAVAAAQPMAIPAPPARKARPRRVSRSVTDDYADRR